MGPLELEPGHALAVGDLGAPPVGRRLFVLPVYRERDDQARAVVVAAGVRVGAGAILACRDAAEPHRFYQLAFDAAAAVGATGTVRCVRSAGRRRAAWILTLDRPARPEAPGPTTDEPDMGPGHPDLPTCIVPPILQESPPMIGKRKLAATISHYRTQLAAESIPALVARTARKRRLRKLAAGRVALEIGGPSAGFGPAGDLPLYPCVASMHNVNFGTQTLWEGQIHAGPTFAYRPGSAPGVQYICEAADLAPIADASYDLLASSHCLEHSANPLRALAEWRRVVRPGGTIVIALPHQAATFDRRRPVTTLAHLVEDFERGTGEDDRTHFEEVCALHDDFFDAPAQARQELRDYVARNHDHRAVHHHTFTTASAVAMLDRAGLQLLDVYWSSQVQIVLIAANPAAGVAADNRRSLRPRPRWRQAAADRGVV